MGFNKVINYKHLPSFSRFISDPYVNALPRPSGPASQVFYRTPETANLSDPRSNFPTSFRRELSQAFSLFYFLQPHSIVRAEIEGRPLSDYLDLEAYQQATLLYVGINDSPVEDQQRSLRAVDQGWDLSLSDCGYILR